MKKIQKFQVFFKKSLLRFLSLRYSADFRVPVLFARAKTFSTFLQTRLPRGYIYVRNRNLLPQRKQSSQNYENVIKLKLLDID